MLSEKIVTLLNDQINNEFFSGYLYLDFANFYENLGLKGFATWFRVQTQEECRHGMLMMQYLQNNDQKVILSQIEKPAIIIKDKMEPLKSGLAHERYVTSLIHNIYDVAYQDKDFRTMNFLDWFIKEQGSEEVQATDLIKKMELFGIDSKGLYDLDAELGRRVFIPTSFSASAMEPQPITP